jgi:hypothetical protein
MSFESSWHSKALQANSRRVDAEPLRPSILAKTCCCSVMKIEEHLALSAMNGTQELATLQAFSVPLVLA